MHTNTNTNFHRRPRPPTAIVTSDMAKAETKNCTGQLGQLSMRSIARDPPIWRDPAWAAAIDDTTLGEAD